ncbi:hypothetical protein OG394_27130 [Kribbella sp. NBC_01245]|nr:hypothetical protein [Kribbella sp. NBC_01245]
MPASIPAAAGARQPDYAEAAPTNLCEAPSNRPVQTSNRPVPISVLGSN